MLYYFPNETKLDIFKCLSYQQLLAFKQTNVYFRDFVNKYEGELAKEMFNMISLVIAFYLILKKNFLLRVISLVA